MKIKATICGSSLSKSNLMAGLLSTESVSVADVVTMRFVALFRIPNEHILA